MTTAKNKIFTGLQHENYDLVGRMWELTSGGGRARIKLWWEGGLLGGFSQVGGMSKFSAGGRGLPPFFPVGKPIYIYIYIYHSASLCTDPPGTPHPCNFFCPLRY